MTALQTSAVMIFGGLLAAAGVLLLVFTRTPGANRIKAFGVEFELSTPALVVFLAGCALVIAPFVVGPREEIGGGGGGRASVVALGTGRLTCSGGARFSLSILKSTVADGVRTVPVRIQNPDQKDSVAIISSELTIADQTGAQLEPLKLTWDPPFRLDATNSYEGRIELEVDPERPLNEITVQTTPNGNCDSLAARARL